MQIQDEVKFGWDFAAQTMGADIAAQLGDGYVEAVENAIAEFARRINGLRSQNPTDPRALGGFVAEEWHAGTFNINAITAGSPHRAWVDAEARQEYASVDIATNFGESYGVKYMKDANATAAAQAELGPQDLPKYSGQERLVPSDQLQGVGEAALRRGASNESTRPELASSYREAATHATDRVSDGEITSIPLSKEEDLQIAREVQQEAFSPEAHGVRAETAIKPEYIINEAAKAGLTAAAVTVAIQLAPEIYKAIDFLIKTGKLNPNHFRQMGEKALSAGAEGFLRGSLSASLLIMCRNGIFGEAWRAVDPTGLATVVSVVLETAKNSILVAAGRMSARQMGAAFVDSVAVAGGYLLGAKIGGAIGQALGFELPIAGYLIGSLVGTAFAAVYNIGKKSLISLCADTGFTCFGLVEQDYTLPENFLREMGVDVISVPRIEIPRTQIPRINIPQTAAPVTGEYETVRFRTVRRGVIGINKIGYVF